MFKLAVIGSRTFTDYQLLKNELDKFPPFTLISGGAKGADKLAEQYADLHDYEKVIFRPNWDLYGKSAGFKRNVEIIQECDECIAFWDGKSNGTQHSINLANQYNKVIKVIKF